MKTVLAVLGNRLVRNVKHNTEIIDEVDNETGHLVVQILDMQSLLAAVQNENLACTAKLKKRTGH